VNTKEFNRDQLKKCFIDLSIRAKELNEPYIQSVAIVLAASIIEESDAELAIWVGEFAKMRINDIEDQIFVEEDENDS
jgi:hypothetical protein